jgi:D-serine deaminase-like pyridoxal phosphate-dependent protein
MPVPDASLQLDTLPQMLLDVAAIERNIAIKEAWTRDHGMVLAPHIKTTMTEEIVRRQLPGCWGVTVATTAQAAKAVEWGARRVLIVNEVLFRGHLEQLRSMLAGSPDLEIYALADSAAGVAAAAEVFRGAGVPLRVLIDVGVSGGRTGIRAAEEAAPLAALITGAEGLLLAGVSAYEGVAPNVRTAENLAVVDSHCRVARDVFETLKYEVESPVFTVGGSAFQDRAAMFLPRTAAVNVLRSGCYVAHDHGTYAGVSPVPGLEAAAVVRALVVSAPEPGRVILNAGKRELAYDAGLPVIVAHYRGAEVLALGDSSASVTKLFDHHAIVDDADGFEVGDIVDLGISHPCSVFDRWREVVAVAPDGVEVWRPVF